MCFPTGRISRCLEAAGPLTPKVGHSEEKLATREGGHFEPGVLVLLAPQKWVGPAAAS